MRDAILCGAGDVVLDLGANVGSFARMAAPVLGPRGCVYCVEPIPDVYVALQLNAEVYKQWAQKHKLPIAKWVCVHAGGSCCGLWHRPSCTLQCCCIEHGLATADQVQCLTAWGSKDTNAQGYIAALPWFLCQCPAAVKLQLHSKTPL